MVAKPDYGQTVVDEFREKVRYGSFVGQVDRVAIVRLDTVTEAC